MPPGSLKSLQDFSKHSEETEQTNEFQKSVEQNKYQKAIPLMRDYLEEHPDSWKTHYLLGYSLFRVNDVQGSIASLKKALELKADSVEAHKVLGLDYFLLGRDDDAEAELQLAARLLPGSPEIHYYLGRIHYTRGTYPLAQKEFELTIRLDSNYMKAYDNLGLTLQALGKDNAAIENYSQAIKLMERNGHQSEWPYVNLSSLYNRQNNPALALKYAEIAVKINPRSYQAYFQMAKACYSKSDWDGATKALNSAIEIKPDSAQYHYMLSRVYHNAGKNEASRKEVKIFMRLRDQDPDAYQRENQN